MPDLPDFSPRPRSCPRRVNRIIEHADYPKKPKKKIDTGGFSIEPKIRTKRILGKSLRVLSCAEKQYGAVSVHLKSSAAR